MINPPIESSTFDLWSESREVSISLVRATPTTLTLNWSTPPTTKAYAGFIVTLSTAPISSLNHPVDGQRYVASADLAVPADTIGGAQVVAARYSAFDGPTATAAGSITITNASPTTIYYASIHGASNVLQYYPVGVQSYPLEAGRVETNINAYAGSIPEADSPPLNPFTGQVFYNPNDNTVKMWNGAAWINASNDTPGTGTIDPDPLTASPALIAGQFFYNSAQRKLKVWNGSSWIDANTDQPGTPTTDKIPIGNDGSYDERVRLINVLKTQLGWPAVCVELSEESFNIAIDNALDEFRRRADNAYQHRHVLFTVKNGQTKYFLNDPTTGTNRIVDIIKIHRVNTLGMNALGGDNGIYAQIFYNQFFYGAMIDVLSIHLVHSLGEEYERLFAGNLMFEWIESSRELNILRRLYRDERVVLECVMERTEQELLVDRWAKQWLQGWALSECFEQLGMIRSKFSTLPGAGGGLSLNGSELLSLATEQQTELLRQIQDFEVGNGLSVPAGALLIG